MIEQLVLLTLMFLADAKTGAGHINAAALRAYLPELSYPAAKRTLQSLHDKRFIYRQITHASKKLYPYWVHAYQLSDGPHKMSWINLAEVFSTHDVGAIKYDRAVPEPVPEGVPEGVPEPVPEPVPEGELNNNTYTDKDIHTDNDNPLGSMQGESWSERSSETARDSHGESNGDGEVSARCADGDGVDTLTQGEQEIAARFRLVRIDGHWCTPNGMRLTASDVAVLFGKDGCR